MKYFDTHCHYDGIASPEDYLARLSGDTWHLMAVGGSLPESLHAKKLAHASDTVWYGAGVHPHAAEEYSICGGDFGAFEEDPKLKAIGELGLDYYYDNSPVEIQKKVFEHFLSIALTKKLPAIVHLRDCDGVYKAYQDGVAILKDFAASGGRFVVHCYSGTTEYADRLLDLGGFLGVTGLLTFKKAENIREIFKIIPLDRLLLETDSPYLAPVPVRGEVNHPANLPYIVGFAAREKGISVEAMAQLSFANGCRFFKIENEV